MLYMLYRAIGLSWTEETHPYSCVDALRQLEELYLYCSAAWIAFVSWFSLQVTSLGCTSCMWGAVCRNLQQQDYLVYCLNFYNVHNIINYLPIYMFKVLSHLEHFQIRMVSLQWVEYTPDASNFCGWLCLVDSSYQLCKNSIKSFDSVVTGMSRSCIVNG